ncbi:MAG: DUF3048 domain-containing protein [Clostridiales bacterium]|nr:DUF3048 domain-containing protein [Candidatus Cacconaster stercorequi]
MKKWIALLMSMLMLLACCVGCGAKKPEEPAQEPVAEKAIPTPKPEPVVVPNPLTGEPLNNADAVNNRPVAVMLNNIHYAMPQHGVSDADMIFEFNVEGGITRMVGFFQEPDKVGTIGSVRSARPCFVETVLGMDAFYAHCGGSQEALNMIYNLGIDDLNATEGVFWRDAERAKTMDYEHTLMTSGENLANYIAGSDWRLQHNADYEYPITYVEDGTPANGTDANHVAVRFSNYKTGTFDYNAKNGKYMIGQYDSEYIDGNTGNQVGVTNLLVLRTTVYDSGDSKGHMVIDLQGSGDGMFFCGGKAIEINWEKAEMSDPFTYYLTDGTPLSLGVGHTYVCVIANDADVTVE